MSNPGIAKQKKVGARQRDPQGRWWRKARSLPTEEYRKLLVDIIFDARMGVGVTDEQLQALGWELIEKKRK